MHGRFVICLLIVCCSVERSSAKSLIVSNSQRQHWKVATLPSSIMASKRTKTTDNNNNDVSVVRGGGSGDQHELLKGRLLVFSVSALYGTLSVAMRLVYSRPDAPTPAALSFCRSWITAISFLLFSKQKQEKEPSTQATPPPSSRPLWTVGMELAFWTVTAFALLSVGLKKTESAIRASFFTQTSVIITPLLSILVDGQSIESSVWVGCIMALAGLLILTMSPSSLEQDASSLFKLSVGDIMVLASAGCWSAYILRAATVARPYPAVQLQSCISKFRAAANTIWLLATGGLAASSATKDAAVGDSSLLSGLLGIVDSQWAGWRHDFVSWCLVAYAATGPGALAAVLLQRGSRHVSASEVNVILCCEPIFTTFWSFLILGETTSLREAFGGMLIIMAAITASGTLDGFLGRLTGSTKKEKGD